MYEIPRWSKKPEQCKRILQTFSNINELSKEQIKCVVKSLQNRIYHIKGYSVFVLIIFKGLLHKLASDGKACRIAEPTNPTNNFYSTQVQSLPCFVRKSVLNWVDSGCWRNRLCQRMISLLRYFWEGSQKYIIDLVYDVRRVPAASAPQHLSPTASHLA